MSLLTVSDPAYPQESTPVSTVARVDLHDAPALLRPLSRLRGTAEESQSIRRFFDSSVVKVLSTAQATEGAVRRELPGKRIIHLAAHGFADEGFGNLFGALALAPPALAGPLKAEDDGFLYLHEIYTLPSLRDCELAVLSACVTNVGPQRPLEAGVTLAGGFLAAGARRVVASHWSVDDRSTAVLMEAFFAVVTDAVKRNQPVDYAAALQKARQKVRQMPEWSAPYYWAPFVLIGPTD
jgi:CHAT domain-containing protein